MKNKINIICAISVYYALYYLLKMGIANISIVQKERGNYLEKIRLIFLILIFEDAGPVSSTIIR